MSINRNQNSFISRNYSPLDPDSYREGKPRPPECIRPFGRGCVLLILLSYFLLSLYACNNSSAGEVNTVVLSASIPDEIISTTTNKYSWQANYDIKNAIVNRVAVPKGFKRIEVKPNSF